MVWVWVCMQGPRVGVGAGAGAEDEMYCTGVRALLDVPRHLFGGGGR